MRITRKSYEKARRTIELAREQTKIVRAWEEAVARLGNLGTQRLIAIIVNEDGSIKTECKPAHVRGDSPAPENQRK